MKKILNSNFLKIFLLYSILLFSFFFHKGMRKTNDFAFLSKNNEILRLTIAQILFTTLFFTLLFLFTVWLQNKTKFLSKVQLYIHNKIPKFLKQGKLPFFLSLLFSTILFLFIIILYSGKNVQIITAGADYILSLFAILLFSTYILLIFLYQKNKPYFLNKQNFTLLFSILFLFPPAA